MSSAALLEQVAAKQELDRRECAADPVVFMGRHVEIEDPDGTVIDLELWPFQIQAIDELHHGKAVIVLKARRLGLSWIFLAYALWLAIFQQGIRVLILCKTGDDAAELLDRIRRMRDRIAQRPASQHLLDRLEPRAVADERDSVRTLDIGASTIKALMGTPAAARSETAGLVLLDEFAFQRGAGEIWRAVLPTIEGGGRIGVISTGNGGEQGAGIGAEFAKQWSRAVAAISGFAALFFPWQARPDRDQAWKRRTLEQLGDPDRFRTEYPEEPADAFVAADADLVYDATHLAAATRKGAELDALPVNRRPSGELWVGIDWGVNTHVLFARRTAGGGLYVFREVVDTRGDIEQIAQDVVTILTELRERISFERFDAAEPIIHQAYRKEFRARTGYNPRWLAIPFGKHKQSAIKYARLLMRRTYDRQLARSIAISPTGCPVLARQLSTLEWKSDDDGKVEKGDDHGPDALLTLTAELAAEFYGRTTDG